MKFPNMRRALHQCVDLVIDAWEADAAEETKPAKRPRAFARPAIELPSDVSNEERERMKKKLEKAGYETNRPSDA